MLNPKKHSLRKLLFAYLIIIITTLIVVLASIFVFTFILAPRFKGLTSVFIFLIIPISCFLVYLYVNNNIKQNFNQNRIINFKHATNLNLHA